MDIGKKAHSYIAGGVANWCNHSGKQYGDSPESLEPPLDPAIPLLSLYPKDLKSAYYRNTATSVFIATQFTIARLWNQPRCPSTDEWIKKLWYIYTMEYYSAVRRMKLWHFQVNGWSWRISC